MSHLSRKEFLRRSLLASVAVPLVPFFTGAKTPSLHIPKTSELTGDGPFWQEVRQQFLRDDRIINLNNGAVGPQPIAVQQVHAQLLEQSSKAPAYFMEKKAVPKREQLRTELADLMDCDAEEVAIDRNTTEGLNTIIFGLDLKVGDEVVVSDFDYPFMLNAWKQRAQRDGIVLKTVKLPLPLEDDGMVVELYRAAITSKTKVMHLTHVLNWTGQIMPVKKITRMAQQLGCDVMVDAAHSLAHIPLSFKEIGCNYMATSLHKWLGAPFGAGALIIKKEKIATVWPLLSAWEPQSADIRKFELLGTRSFPAEMAALDAISFHRDMGLERVNQRLHYLKTYWAEQVTGMKGVTFHTSLRSEFSGAMATFSIKGLNSQQIADALFDSHGLLVGTIRWNGLDAVRVSPHIYTSLKELDMLVAGIAKLTER